MAEKRTIERARRAKRMGKASSTQAGEFVREEIHHVREGKHGATSPQQVIAIGLSKARRAGVPVPAPGQKAGTQGEGAATIRTPKSSSGRRSRAIQGVLMGESRRSASGRALSRQARSAARKRGRSARKAAARLAVQTKGPAARREAARKAAATRRRSRG